jgi:hypothetical protein
VSDAIARFAVEVDWDGLRPVSETAPNANAATRWNPTAIRHDRVGGMNESVDFRRYHPELVAGPPDA